MRPIQSMHPIASHTVRSLYADTLTHREGRLGPFRTQQTYDQLMAKPSNIKSPHEPLTDTVSRYVFTTVYDHIFRVKNTQSLFHRSTGAIYQHVGVTPTPHKSMYMTITTSGTEDDRVWAARDAFDDACAVIETGPMYVIKTAESTRYFKDRERTEELEAWAVELARECIAERRAEAHAAADKAGGEAKRELLEKRVGRTGKTVFKHISTGANPDKLIELLRRVICGHGVCEDDPHLDALPRETKAFLRTVTSGQVRVHTSIPILLFSHALLSVSAEASHRSRCREARM